MKSFHQSIKVAMLTSLLGLTLNSCQDAEFYQKEYLEGYGVPEEQRLSDDPDTQEGIMTPERPGNIPGQGSTSLPGQGSTSLPGQGSTSMPGQTPDQNQGQTQISCDASSLMHKVENFTQNMTSSKVDIIWVMDNSGSMGDEQEDLARNFDAFINEFITRDIDFKMGITTTDGRSEYNGNVIGNLTALTSVKAKEDEQQFINTFKSWIKVGVRGSGNEKGLQTSKSFLQKHASSFLRPDAYLVVVYVSDEEDHSLETSIAYANYFKSLKKNEGMVKVHSIVQTPEYNIAEKYIGYRYKSVSDLTGGTTSSIHQDFYTTLSNMGIAILELVDSFALAKSPIVSTIEVSVDSVDQTSGYDYISSSRLIKFDQNSVPDKGSQIKIEYDYCPGAN